MTKQERWVQSVLNNAVYYLNEPPDLNLNESDYSLPSKDDKVSSTTTNLKTILIFQVLLCFDKGIVVGFCTIKCKGNSVPGSNMEKYSMDIVDSVFIKKSHRRRGHATGLLNYLVENYQGNIGFSSPISDGMKDLLIKFLDNHVNKRDLLWQCEDNGDVGKRFNIWMNRRSL